MDFALFNSLFYSELSPRLISTGLDFGQRYGPIKQDKTSTNLKRFYCQLVCLMLWFFAIRGFVLMFISDREIQLMLGDLTGFWNDYRMYYLMPTFYYSLQTAIIATIFLRNEQEVRTETSGLN